MLRPNWNNGIRILLEFMCIKEFWWNVLSSISFNITPCYLCNASSSNNIVESPLIEESPHDSWICWIIDLSHIYSWLVSWIASIFEWFDDVTTIVCLTDLHEITIPLQLNTYPICDLHLYGFKRYHAFAYPSNCFFDSLE